MARPRTYIIKLSDDERAELKKTIHNKKTSKTILKRCQILLELDAVHGLGLTHAQIAHSYAVCTATITSIIQSYVRNGITNIVRYNITPNSRTSRHKVDGCTEAHIIQMACEPVPDGHSRWTFQLREEKACIELDVLIGKNAIRHTLIDLLRQELAAWESEHISTGSLRTKPRLNWCRSILNLVP